MILTQFQSFLRAIAARSGQLVNLAGLGQVLGLATNTRKTRVSVLEATHQIVILRPYHASVVKRLVKTPKIYFADTNYDVQRAEDVAGSAIARIRPLAVAAAHGTPAWSFKRQTVAMSRADCRLYGSARWSQTKRAAFR